MRKKKKSDKYQKSSVNKIKRGECRENKEVKQE